IRRSDVVFMYDNPKMYQPYGCTVMGWAGRADAKHIAEAHAKGVRLFSASVGFRTEGRGMIDFSDDFLDAACRDFDDKPILVPWLWDHEYKGNPFYWWCTNSPLFHAYLEGRLESVMKAAPDGLHIDDYSGTAGAVTWLSGCFCRHCMAGFRAHLADNVDQGKLVELGVTDLDGFDYRRFLLAQGVKPEDYKRKRASLPLAAEFLDFHVKANNAFVAQYRRKAEEIRGAPLTLCVNSGLSRPQTLVIAPHLSYFCCEVPHNAAGRAAAKHPVYVYKLADGLDRPVTSTASGHDWAYVMEHNLPCLVRTWVALSYAHGHTLMAPHRQWCYNKEKGTHWYTGPVEDYAHVYQFVRRNSRLFDRYEAIQPVAVVYDNAARRRNKADVEPICVALAEKNVPFTVVVAGDDWLDYRLDRQRLARFKAVVVPKDLAMDQDGRKLIDQVEADGRLVVWPEADRLAKLVPEPIVVEGSDSVGVVPRAIRDDDDAPPVVHLLNRAYDGDNDACVPQNDFTLRLRKDLFADRAFTGATLHAPNAYPIPLPLNSDPEYIVIKIPQLKLWAIVELVTSDGPS
ncbi:MAG: hypothetical protein HQ582_22310, partial [Planctomycetes bacterium]|nr:hypothetical protein [Planctomycetota bacterium]